jgi:hypothetical protein
MITGFLVSGADRGDDRATGIITEKQEGNRLCID